MLSLVVISFTGLFALNVIVASIVIGAIGMVLAVATRRSALPFRHSILVSTVILAILCPALVLVATAYGFGVFPVEAKSPIQAASERRKAKRPADAMARAIANSHDSAHDEPSNITSTVLGAVDSMSTTRSQSPTDSNGSHIADEQPIQNGNVFVDVFRDASRVASVKNLNDVGVWIGLIWGAVSLWLALRLVRGVLLVRILRRSLRPVAEVRVLTIARQYLGAELAVYESPLAPVPLTIGMWNPVIVLPKGLAETFDDEQLGAVLVHEGAHVSRRDTMFAMFQQIGGVFYWWNPLLHMLNRRLNNLREFLCDDHVVTHIGDGLPLANAIVRVVEWSSDRSAVVPFAATLLDDEDSLETRITRLADRHRTITIGLNWRNATAIVAVALPMALVPLVPLVRARPIELVVQTDGASNTSLPAGEWKMRVRAVDERGSPVVNGRIGLQYGPDEGPLWHDTDQQGWASVKFPSRAVKYCYVLARGDGVAPMRAFWSNREEDPEDLLPADFTFEMPRATEVGGVVMNEEKKPVPGAIVLFSAGVRRSSANRAEVTFDREPLTTDAKGRWVCVVAPASINTASIVVSHPDYVAHTMARGLDNKIPELLSKRHEWKLRKGFAVSGRVTDENGMPISKGTLVLGELNVVDREGPFAVTDEEGRYRFEKVSPKYDLSSDDDPIRFTISIVRSGFAPIMEAVPGFGKRPLGDSTPQERTVNFILRRGAPLKLHVVDANQQPIAGAMVIPSRWRDTTPLSALQKFGIPSMTNGQGEWHWPDAPIGQTIAYDVLAKGFSDVRNRPLIAQANGTYETIVLRKPQHIAGTVVDAKTNKPIPEFTVERAFENIGGEPMGLYWTANATRGKDGKYRMPVLMPPPNGSYTYRANAMGYQTAVSKSVPYAEGETTLNFELQPTADDSVETTISVTGRAMDLDGKPIGGATIYLISTNGIDKHLGETKTDGEGRYEFSNVRLPCKKEKSILQGTIQVYGEPAADSGLGIAWHGMRHYIADRRPEFRPKNGDESAFYAGEPIDMNLVFRPARKLTGTVKNEKGEPVANVQLNLGSLDYLAGEGHEIHMNFREFWGIYMSPDRFHVALTDAAGRFEFQSLPDETTGFLIIKHRDYATQSMRTAITDKQISFHRYSSTGLTTIVGGKQVTTPNWEKRDVRVGPLEIRVESTNKFVFQLHNAGKPIAGVRLIASSGPSGQGVHANGTSNEEGRVELALPPGKYRLVADPPRDSQFVRTYGDFEASAASRETTTKLQVDAGCILVFKAIDPDGNPVAGVGFWCDAGNGRQFGVQSSTTFVDNPVTNDKGEFRAVVLPGTREYGAGWTLPPGYRTNRQTEHRSVTCEAGKTVRLQFKVFK